MPSITGKSLERLRTVHPSLQVIISKANNIMELSVLCGVREEAEQNKAFAEGKSKLKWPDSKHNLKPGQQYSNAVDIIPYFIGPKDNYDWDDALAFAFLAGICKAIAVEECIKIRWGGDWDSDGRTKDERFLDLPHIELID